MFDSGQFKPNLFTINRYVNPPSEPGSEPENTGGQAFCDIRVDLGLQIDKLLVDEFGGNVAEAKMFAMSAASVMANIWQSVGNDFPVNLSFSFSTHIVWFPDPYLDSNDDLFDSNVAQWFNNIGNDWSTNRPCIRKDGIIYITGRQGVLGTPTARGVTDGNPDFFCENPENDFGNRKSIVSIQKNGNNEPDEVFTGQIMAHELGHHFGLLHEDLAETSGGCGINCSQEQLLMCESSNGTTLSSCMKSKLILLLSDLPNVSRCPCLTASIPTYQTEDCEVCYAKATTVIADNPNPVKGCGATREEINFTATLKGGCEAANDVIVRVRYDKNLLKPKLDLNGMVVSNYFTHEQSAGVIYNELIGRLPGTPPGPEKTIDLALGDMMTLTFSMLFDPQPGLEVKKYSVQVYISSPDENFSEAVIEPFFEITAQSGQSVFDILPPSGGVRHFHIIGDMDIPPLPVPLPSTEYVTNKPEYLFNGYHFIMHDGNEINVEGPVQLINGSIGGCTTMWKGVELHSGSRLHIRNSDIKDAAIAINIGKNSVLTARSSGFLDNNIAIHANDPGTGSYNIMLSGNHYGATAGGLKPAYSGQSPLPFGKGFAGIYLNNAGSVVLDADVDSGESNAFFNLKYGVISLNTNLNVLQADFQDITQVAKGSGYTAYPAVSTGKAIYAEKGSVSVIPGDDRTITFNNCHTGVETLGASSFVWRTTMDNMTNGIITTNGVAIHDHNTIAASIRGIDLRYLPPLGFATPAYPVTTFGGVYGNTIDINGNSKARAVSVAGILTPLSPSGPTGAPLFMGGNINGNTINMNDGQTAIHINDASLVTAARNIVSLANAQNNRFGMYLGAGDKNTLSCNNVTGPGATGIYAIHPGRASILCNLAANTGEGLHIEGMLVGKDKAYIGGNLMKNNDAGLLYGVDAITGEQVHRGNRWEGARRARSIRET
ncbi:MAG: hypothetical protein IPK76_02115 [Lewinellaceae bacterium]|nr:hypothetical protein [Lewinellaceae bacterium]